MGGAGSHRLLDEVVELVLEVAFVAVVLVVLLVVEELVVGPPREESDEDA